MQQETQKTGNKKQTTQAAQTPAKVEPKQVAVAQDFGAGGWDTETVDTKDILIPKLLLMHPTSELVKKGQRNIGEIIKSTSEEVVSKRGDTFDVIVFEKWKEWRIMKKDAKSGRYEFVRIEPWTNENDSLPWDYTEGADEFRRDKTMNFYGVLTSDIEKGQAFPVKLSFVRTGFKTGLKIADAYSRSVMMKIPPINQVFKIGSELKEGKEESFFAFTVALGDQSTEEQKNQAMLWRQTVMQAKKSNAIVDHDVDEEPVTGNAKATDNTDF